MQNQNPFTAQDVKLVQREVLYKGVFCLSRLTLQHRLFNGGWSEIFTRELFERYSAVGVLPYDPKLDRVILIEQFRPGSLRDPKSPWLIEIPAGVISKHEEPEVLARREAEEEAGCLLTELQPICDYYVSPGGCDEYIHLFCGRVDASNVNGVHGLKHEHEDIRVLNLSVTEALAKLSRGEIKTSPAITALYWLQLNQKILREKWQN